jgi:GT2 family glycosyltransferase
VEVVPLGRNEGGAGRNHGVALARTPYVAFSDDDSWWAPGSLGRAVQLFEAHPRLALIAGRILVGPEQRLDPVCSIMADSGLKWDARLPDMPGVPITSFIACGALVRREAFLAAGGFHPRLGVGGEEELLALDLLRLGWHMAYCEDVTAHHYPSAIRNAARRQRRQVRNALWSAWLRRPASSALAATWRVAASAWRQRPGLSGLLEALLGLPWVLLQRRPVPAAIDRQVRIAEASFYSADY